MFLLRKFYWLCLIWSFSITVLAAQVNINDFRYWNAPDHTRLVFDISGPANHQIFTLDKPGRLVIDFSNARLTKSLAQPAKNQSVFSRIRSAERKQKDLRVVLDLKSKVSPKSFLLKPNKQYGHRLVVDLYKDSVSNSASAKISQQKAVKTVKNQARDVVIAIDAGHGGEDPGARGRNGTREKVVVLQIAKKLARLINQQKGMRAVLIRKGDYYIKLRKRMELARQAKADLFVSIHADAFKSSKVKGASVFTLSNKGASSEAARWLAKQENAADLVGGIKLADKEDMLASVLMDLSQSATKEASGRVAGKILGNLKYVSHLHNHNVQKANFMVLKSPDIPSVLVETAFISNPSEERKLNSKNYQNKLAKAVYKGIVSYFTRYAPSDTYFALNSAKQHVISRGETLSEIARYYGVSMKSIKAKNSLASNQIRIGQVLKIPKS